MISRLTRKMAASRKAFSFIIGMFVLLVLFWYAYRHSMHDSGIRGSVAVDDQSDSAGDTAYSYGIIIDAGSTGSRVHVFKFKSGVKGEIPELIEETFEQVKPGISYYADNPKMGANSLTPLLDVALKTVPHDQYKTTPLALKATAGLRLLPSGAADRLLSEILTLFKSKYLFYVKDNAAEIISGTEEGIFSWVTVNYLLGTLSKPGSTAAALDLGGGSIQESFVPKEKETFTSVPGEYIKTLTLFNKEINLFTHSYLGLGLMSGRAQMMGLTEDSEASSSSVNNQLHTPCLRADAQTTWSHGGTDYIVSGNQGPISENYVMCLDTAKSLVKTIIKTPEINSQDIYIFSYFYDRAFDAGLITGNKGGMVTVRQYRNKAAQICNDPPKDNPFLCMDLTYIYALLYYGFGISKHEELYLRKTINDVEISWALGAMFDLAAHKNEKISTNNR